MARLPRQKQKLLYIQKILLEKTDEEHGLTVNEIISELNSYGINAERKSIYGDLRLLEAYGLDICSEKSKTVRYYIG
jgi:Fe2+ or Zn2+ uptake regulation protein